LKHTSIVILLIIICVVLLSGCKNNYDAKGENKQGHFYKAEVISFPELPAGYEEISNITLAGDIVYFTASINNLSDNGRTESFNSVAIFSMASDGTNLRKLPGYISQSAPPPAASGGGLFIYAMQADADGNILLIEAERYYVSEEPDIFKDAGNTFRIRKLDKNGTELLSADISDLAASFDGFYISMFFIDDDGHIYIGYSYILKDETTIHIMDSNFKSLLTLEAPVFYNPFILTSDGSVAFIRQQNTERYLQKIDVDRKALGSSIHLPENADRVFSGNNDYLVLFTDSTGLYGISDESENAMLILNWIDVGIIPDGLKNISFLHNDHIFLTKSTLRSGSGEQINELIILTKTEPDSDGNNDRLTEKTELTLGTLSLNPQLQKPILEFNNASTSHYITVIDYSSNTTADDIEGALLRFSTEITTGKIPDIFILSSMPFDRLIALDLLEDLYPYLDSDPELSRDSLLESVLRASETNGKLYLINQTFTISTILGDPLVLGEYPGWNMEEFKAVLDANPQADIPFGPRFTKQDFLWVLLYMNLYEYIDISSGAADFDNVDFIELLKFANTFSSKVDDSIYDRLFGREIKAEGRQIMDTFVGDLYNYVLQKESFGGEIVFKGWPAADRNGSRFISHDYVAISIKAADKDGAWDFIRTLLMEEHQREYFYHFPINKSVFEERMKQNMEPMSFMHGGATITVEPTQKDADEIAALINTTTKITGHGGDEKLRDIIIESATDFFNGLISAEDAARIIQSRVTIYMSEQSR